MFVVLQTFPNAKYASEPKINQMPSFRSTSYATHHFPSHLNTSSATKCNTCPPYSGFGTSRKKKPYQWRTMPPQWGKSQQNFLVWIRILKQSTLLRIFSTASSIFLKPAKSKNHLRTILPWNQHSSGKDKSIQLTVMIPCQPVKGRFRIANPKKWIKHKNKSSTTPNHDFWQTSTKSPEALKPRQRFIRKCQSILQQT